MMPGGMLGRKIMVLFPVDVPSKPTTSSPSDVFCKFTQPEKVERERGEKLMRKSEVKSENPRGLPVPSFVML